MNPRLLLPALLALTVGPIRAEDLRELRRQFVNTRYLAYFHYNMNTFSGEGDWGSGKIPPEVWNPTGLDCDQWARTCIRAGMAGGILTTKHHDGFCLWDSKAPDPDHPAQETAYDVASAPVKTDVVRAFTESFRAKGLKVGLYFSIWDRHFAVKKRGVTPARLAFVKAQITELLTRYGKIDYINFDGWTPMADSPTFDDIPFAELLALVKSLQPDCVVLNHSYECNPAHTEIPFADATVSASDFFFGDYTGPSAGSDILQTQWFWTPGIRIKRDAAYVRHKLELYHAHNSVYVLNLAPNRAGRLDDDLVARLDEIAATWKKPADVVAAPDDWGVPQDVAGNLALRKPCAQSGTYEKGHDRLRPEIANDGVTAGNPAFQQISRTDGQKDPWWRVDLGAAAAIEEIRIHHRTGATAPETLTVTLLDKTGKTVFEHRWTTDGTGVSRIRVGGKSGSRVLIRHHGEGVLELAEVVVTPASR